MGVLENVTYSMNCVVLCPDTNISNTSCKTSARRFASLSNVKPFKISVSVLMQNFWTCNVRLLVCKSGAWASNCFLYICSHPNGKCLKQEVVSNSTLCVRRYELTLWKPWNTPLNRVQTFVFAVETTIWQYSEIYSRGKYRGSDTMKNNWERTVSPRCTCQPAGYAST